jgi:hypothetical protein
MKERSLRSRLLPCALSLLLLAGCSPIPGPTGPSPTPVKLESLLVELSSFPSDWEVYFSVRADPYVAVDNIYVSFRATDGSDLAHHAVYLYPDESSARQAWWSESRGFSSGRLTPWETPAELPYQSPVADQFRFFCADIDGGPFGVSGVYTLCLAIARYGRYLSDFSTFLSPEHMTWTDIERILQEIDRRMAERLAAEGR